MIELQSILQAPEKVSSNKEDLSFHPSFVDVNNKIKQWQSRFFFTVDDTVFHDLHLLYLLATKKFLDHRISIHLFRLVVAIYFMQKKLLQSTIFSPQSRHLQIRWIPTNLLFPFASKPVLGCLIGCNIIDRYELFDEENIHLTLQKYYPSLRIVKESSYAHASPHKNLKFFYLEIEKKNGTPFSAIEQRTLKNSLEEKLKNSIQTLAPSIFMGNNDEEIYKNIMVLSQELDSLSDIPQAYIALDQQTGIEIIFRITLVYISPFHRFSLQERFFECSFISERILPVRFLEERPIEAHIFRLLLPREASLLRSDGSLDFHSARQKIVASLKTAIGEFRDYNGGILFKQQELLHDFKKQFPDISNNDLESLENFFYGITPLEKQMMLSQDTLSTLFSYFLDNRKEKLPKDATYSFKMYRSDHEIFLIVHGDNSISELLSSTLQDPSFRMQNIAYNILKTEEGTFFNCVLLQAVNGEAESFIQLLQESFHNWHKKKKEQQILRIGLEYSLFSLDPRIGGEAISGEVLRFLFEGLTRINQNGKVECAVAKSIEISPDLKEYIFKLRSSFWNDGTPVTAYDFEYSWKKILSPDFKTAFATNFYHIKNAKKAKEGVISSDQIGIEVLDDFTLKVTLEHPTPYFLQLTSIPFYSPIHRIMDQQHPQWPYQHGKNYPCNGPFQLKINQQQGYQLVKNTFYWDINNILLDQVIFNLMNSTQALQAFRKKEIDWIGNPFGSWQPTFVPEKEDQLITLPNSWICWLVFNTSKPPFNHRKIRQAFAHIIQRTELISGSYLHLHPAFSPLLPHFLKNQHSLFPDYHLATAQQLFQEALEELNIDRKNFPSLNFVFHQKGVREYTAHCLKKQFQEGLGVDCTLHPLPWSAIFNKITSGDFQLGLVHWTSWVDDPVYTLNAFRFVKDDLNFSKWEHAEFQRLLDVSDQEINPFQRSSYLLQAEHVLCQEVPIIPLFYQPYQSLVHKGLRNVYLNQWGFFNLTRSFYKKEV